MKIKLTVDNEWEGKYEALEKQFLDDEIPIWALGDLLPTGPKKAAGEKSYFMTELKILVEA